MPEIDLGLAVAGLVVGAMVGLTGMGGGALMTPLLVLGFGVDPLAAVSSDLVASMCMKPIGGGVHLRRGTVHRGIATWLVLGSIPTAFAGALLLDLLGDGESLARTLEILLGTTLLIAASLMVGRARLEASRERAATAAVGEVAVRRGATLAVGIGGGLFVGLTSVGSGSLMIVAMMMLYPRLPGNVLVGTDLVQAVPLVAAAAAGHALFGAVDLGVTGPLLVGAIPGVYLGARASSRAPDHLLRPILVVLLSASGLRLVGLPTAAALACVPVVAVVIALAGRRAASGGGVSDDRNAEVGRTG